MTTKEDSIERLWAPWRLEHLKKRSYENTEESKGCPFCEMKSEKASKENLILHRGKDYFVVMNRYPYNPYHLLILPSEHIGNILEIEMDLWTKITQASKLCIEILNKSIGAHGYNMGINMGKAGGGSIIGHLHLHILPRWSGDTNFLPLLADTKSLPVYNEEVYDILKDAFLDFKDRLNSL